MNREDVIRMAREAGYAVQNFDGEDEVMDGDNYHIQTDKIERFAALVAAHERRKCEDEAITKNIVANWPYDKWVGLTDEELAELSASGLALWELWRAIEAKLKEKNNGT